MHYTFQITAKNSTNKGLNYLKKIKLPKRNILIFINKQISVDDIGEQ